MSNMDDAEPLPDLPKKEKRVKKTKKEPRDNDKEGDLQQRSPIPTSGRGAFAMETDMFISPITNDETNSNENSPTMGRNETASKSSSKGDSRSDFIEKLNNTIGNNNRTKSSSNLKTARQKVDSDDDSPPPLPAEPTSTGVPNPTAILRAKASSKETKDPVNVKARAGQVRGHFASQSQQDVPGPGVGASATLGPSLMKKKKGLDLGFELESFLMKAAAREEKKTQAKESNNNNDGSLPSFITVGRKIGLQMKKEKEKVLNSPNHDHEDMPDEATKLVSILSNLQEVDGSWDLDSRLITILEVPNAESLLGTATNSRERKLLATSLVLSFLNEILKESDRNAAQLVNNMVERASYWIVRTQHTTQYMPFESLAFENMKENVIAHVVCAEQRQEYLGTYTAFKIEIATNSPQLNWVVYRRYEDFVSINKALRGAGLIGKEIADRLPHKVMPAFSESHKLSFMLDDWLRNLIEKGDDHWSGRSAQAIPYLLQFLAPKQVGDIAYDNEEVTLTNLMDEKWSALERNIHKAVAQGKQDEEEAEATPLPTLPPVDDADAKNSNTSTPMLPHSQSEPTTPLPSLPAQPDDVFVKPGTRKGKTSFRDSVALIPDFKALTGKKEDSSNNSNSGAANNSSASPPVTAKNPGTPGKESITVTKVETKTGDGPKTPNNKQSFWSKFFSSNNTPGNTPAANNSSTSPTPAANNSSPGNSGNPALNNSSSGNRDSSNSNTTTTNNSGDSTPILTASDSIRNSSSGSTTRPVSGEFSLLAEFRETFSGDSKAGSRGSVIVKTDKPKYNPPPLEIPKKASFVLPTDKEGGGHSERSLVCWEIYNTELSYVRSLDIIQKVFLDPLRNPASPHYKILPEDELKTIFPVIDELRSFHGMMLNELEERLKNWNHNQLIGDIFLRFSPFFKIYSSYCKAYHKSNEKIQEAALKKTPLNLFIETGLRNPECSQPDLQSYLIMPVQRLPRVMLLLKDFLKKTEKKHPDFANIEKSLTKVKEVIEVVNDTIRYNEKEDEFWNEPLLKPLMAPQRKPICRGNLKLRWPPVSLPPNPTVVLSTNNAAWLAPSGTTQVTCQCYLFNDLFVITMGDKILDTCLLDFLWMFTPTNTHFILATPEKVVTCAGEQYPQHLEWVTDLKNALDKVNKGGSAASSTGTNTTSNTSGTSNNTGGLQSSSSNNPAPNNSSSTSNASNTDDSTGTMVGSTSSREGVRIGTYTYSDGTVYAGEWLTGPIPTGNGILKRTNSVGMSVIYKGELKTKKMDGNGSVKFGNGDTFVGQFKDDLPHGVGTLTLTSGLIYSGEWNMGKKHGQGKLSAITSKDTYFYGEWKDDLMHGYGELYVASNYYKGDWFCNRREGKGECSMNGWLYKGDWSNDAFHGNGELLLGAETGEKYTGGFREDLYHGEGKLTTMSFVFNGEWVGGKKQGKGIMEWKNGDKYNGQWVADQPEGKGVYQYKSGITYDGYFKGGLRDGEGMMKYPNGDVYEGSFKDDMRHGKGKMINYEGIYEGQWLNDMRDGEGNMTYADKRRYIGLWKNNQRNGKGIMISPDGSKFEGNFKNDRKNGKGTYTDYTGKYVGNWVQDRQHGKGTFFSITDNSVYEGDWVNGVKHGKGALKLADGKVVEQTYENGSLLQLSFAEFSGMTLRAPNLWFT